MSLELAARTDSRRSTGNSTGGCWSVCCIVVEMEVVTTSSGEVLYILQSSTSERLRSESYPLVSHACGVGRASGISSALVVFVHQAWAVTRR